MASPIADPGIKASCSTVIAQAFAAIDAVPNPAIMLWVSSFPIWNILFSSACGTPMEKIFFIISLSHPARNHFVQWISYFS